MRPRSIKLKILTALLALSLVPLVLFVLFGRSALEDMRERVKTELAQDAQHNLAQLARDQAAIASAILDKVEVETTLAAFWIEALLRDQAADAGGNVQVRTGTDASMPISPAPGLEKGLDELFAAIRGGDPNLTAIYLGTPSGVLHESPPSVGNQALDPVTRPWYARAVATDGAVWTKYADWGPGQQVASIDPGRAPDIGKTVSPRLAEAFADLEIPLVEGAAISAVQSGRWRLKDRNGKNYEIRAEGGALAVNSIDILTCSRAVRGPNGHPAGAIGLDIGMEAISGRIIRTPKDVMGDAFLLDPRGELVEQERLHMFVPGHDNPIRVAMRAGRQGIGFDAASSTYVAYAPIRAIPSRDGKSFASLGISMSQQEILRLATELQERINALAVLLFGALLGTVALILLAAWRLSKGITGPILAVSAHARRLGRGDLYHRISLRTGDEIEALGDAFNTMAADLRTYIENLARTTAKNERFESELRVAREIQMSFLKRTFAPFAERPDVSLFAAIEPAREVGGDLYDFALIDEHRLMFYIGDVADKGIPAALVMARTMTLMKQAARQPGITPSGVLREVNEALAEDNDNGMFVTLFIGILEPGTGRLAYSNAGHNPPLVLGADGGCGYLELPSGLVLGALSGIDYIDLTTTLAPGDLIFTYTDGVSEAMSPTDELYSEERLKQALTSFAAADVEQAVAGVIASVRRHAAGAPQSDDMTVLAVRFHGLGTVDPSICCSVER